jgi:geranylgeranyl diphosphate synthase type II
MEESKKRAFDLVEKAKKAIEPWGAEAKYLISLADFITNRDR